MDLMGDQPIRRLTIGVYLGVAAFLVAHSVNAFVASSLALPPLKPAARSVSSATPAAFAPQQWADQIQGSGLFLLPAAPLGMSGLPGTSAQTPVRAVLGVATKLRLLGVVLGNERGVFAIVEELATKRQVLYRLHDQIPDVGEVSAIRRDGMVVRSGDQEELLELSTTEKPPASAASPSASPAPLAPGTPLRKVLDRREVEAAMADLPKLLTQARAVPYMVNGAPSGYRMDYIAPASFYEKIGIQYGDVLQRVNGVDVRDPSTMLSLFQQLKNERTVKVDMVRNNQKTTMTYELR